ncbi:MAG: hypothetical protein ACK5W5_03510 [Cyanobacteriota bacterium]
MGASRRVLFSRVGAAALLASAVVLPTSVQAIPTYTGQVVATELLNPRGLTVDP